VKKILLLISMFGLPALALAASGAPADPQAVLNGLNKTLLDWTSGSLATGLAITMLLMGTGMAVARNTPFPAVMGVAGAAFLTWGPSIIMSLAMPQGPAQVATNPVPRVSAPSAHASMPQAASGTVAFKALASTALGSAGLSGKSGAASQLAQFYLKEAQESSPRITAGTLPEPASTAGTATVQKYPSEKPDTANDAPSVQAPATAEVPVAVASQPVTSRVSALAKTVPVPAAMAPSYHVSTKPVSSSDLTRLLGVAGSVVILSLLGLLAYLSSRRRSKNTGFTPGATSGAGSVFTDPHGFRREKNLTGFNP
jgi:conjugal transfer pilus assembly protein TraA